MEDDEASPNVRIVVFPNNAQRLPVPPTAQEEINDYRNLVFPHTVSASARLMLNIS